MQTIQIQCGGCGNPMAIALEHLGAQVQCPYCQAVVQTPSSPHGSPPGLDLAPPPQQISAPPPPPPIDHGYSPKPSAPLYDAAEHVEPNHEPADEAYEEAPEDQDEEPVDIAAMRDRVRQARKSSTISATFLVYLVPFVICCTGFIGYLLFTRPKVDQMFPWLAP